MTSGDLATIDAVISALYEARSHVAGERPDWDRFRTLFVEAATVVQAYPGAGHFHVWQDTDLYIFEHDEGWDPSVSFLQVELGRRADSAGDIGHAFSAYEQRYANGRGAWTERGVNSFHLARDRARGEWRITGWTWGEGDGGDRGGR